jgi:hypothetical protein
LADCVITKQKILKVRKIGTGCFNTFSVTCTFCSMLERLPLAENFARV